MIATPSAILLLACSALPAIPPRQGHIAKLFNRFDLSANEALLHIPVCEGGRLLPYFFHKRMRFDGKDSILRSTRQTLIERLHRILSQIEAG